MRRLVADFEGKAAVHQPSSARRNKEGCESRDVGVGLDTDNERLQDAGVYHEADRANQAEAQKPVQDSTRGGAICR